MRADPARNAPRLVAVDKETILAEIRRTAEANGGRPLGRARFASETGIREHDWSGRYWARWSEALAEAGFASNQLQGRIADDVLFESLASEVRRLGRLPTTAEMKLRRREDVSFPNAKVFERLGPKATWPRQLVAHFDNRADMADVVDILQPLVVEPAPEPEDGPEAAGRHGYVYLLKSGRFYKVGHTLDVGRRRYDLAIQLPEPVTEEHVIATDDPPGIERYWHARFANRRKNGEWFELTRADVTAFKRRKFM
jgi:Meiotically Up-regulated Gene 113 (MUG113) protein